MAREDLKFVRTPMKRTNQSPSPGIRRHGAGWQVRAVYRGQFEYAAFPVGTPPKEMIDWQAKAVAKMTLEKPKAPGGTFAADAQRYLALSSIKALTTYEQREQHIQDWVNVFGPKRRRAITSLDIEAQRDHWFLVSRGTGPDGKPLKPFSAGSVNKRLRALSNLYTKLDGRRAENPVLEVDECEEPDPEARGLPYDVIEAILNEIPDTFVGWNKAKQRTPGKGNARPSKTKARLRVIAYTGLTQKQLGLLTREQVDLVNGTVLLSARRKGRKLRRAHERALPQLLPLVPQAVDAFKEFDRLDCWGPFSNSSMRHAFKRACARLGMSGLRPYDFRHSFGTLIYGETRDLRATGALLSQRSERTTRRYTIASVAPHIAAAVESARLKLSGERASHAGTRSGTETAAKVLNRSEKTVSQDMGQAGLKSSA